MTKTAAIKLKQHTFVSVLMLLLLAVTPAQAKWFKTDAAIMGTAIHVELWHENAFIARQNIKRVLDEMRRIDTLMSPFKEESELSYINRHAAIKPVKISNELFKLIQRSIRLSEQSSGAFDITFASLGRFYDYRKKIRPDKKQFKTYLKDINYRHIRLNPEKKTIFFTRRGTKIDLGGIAKGHAVDNAIALLQQHGIREAMVSAGGDTRIIGDRHGRPWYVGIRDPRQKDKSAIVLPLSQSAISTSGDYERYFIHNKVRYHHIIRPDTGDSARELRSVSILGPDSTSCDGLSTTVFILGLKKGMKLIASLPDFEAIIIDNKGRIYYSDGLKAAQ